MDPFKGGATRTRVRSTVDRFQASHDDRINWLRTMLQVGLSQVVTDSWVVKDKECQVLRTR